MLGERIRFQREMSDLGIGLPSSSEWPDTLQFEQETATWEQKVFRAVHGGERAFGKLVALGREAGGDNKSVQKTVRDLLRVPFPKSAQTGGITCRKNVRDPAKSLPEASSRFTGRFESKKESGHQYFWAINQAGKAVVAVRTPRGILRDGLRVKPPKVIHLHGDVQPDGTAVLFNASAPDKFWGYLELQDDLSFKFNAGSYRDKPAKPGQTGKRVVVDPAMMSNDEVLKRSDNARPTMMASTMQSPDPYLTRLIREHEWYPFTKRQLEIISNGARSGVLRDLLESYLKLPRRSNPITVAERKVVGEATGRIRNYIEHLLWDGDLGRKPDILGPIKGDDDEKQRLDARLKGFSEEARSALPNGHHNNPWLAAHVTKALLANEELNYAGAKQTFLDWLTKVAQEQKNAKLATLLDVPVTPPTGSYRYRVRCNLATGAYGVAIAMGTMRVDKVSAPAWPAGTIHYEIFGGGLGTPQHPDYDELFDLEIDSARELTPDDFEGSLYLGEASASFGFGRVKPKANAQIGHFHGKHGFAFDFDDLDVTVRGQPKKPSKKKPKLKFGAMVLWASVERKGRRILDLRKPFPPEKSVVGELMKSVHFCLGSSLLEPAGRQYLRVICADQLALLTNPDTKIMLAGHTDRMDNFKNNTDLSRLRVENVKQSLQDILGNLRSDWSSVKTYQFSELFAILTGKRDQVPNAADRRVDMYVNGRLTATFRDVPS